MDKEYRNLTGTTILFAGSNIISKLLKILIVPFYTYYLATSEFGAAETVTMTVNLLFPVFLLGVNEAAVRFSMKEDISPEDVVSNCLAVVTATSLTGLILLLPLAHVPVLKDHLVLMYLMIVASAVESLLMSLAKGLGRNTVFAVSEIISTVTLLASNVIMLAVLRTGIEGYLGSMVIASAARILFIAVCLRLFRFIRPQAVNSALIASILRFSLPFMPATILWWVMESSGRYMVIWFIGASAAGIYAVAFRLSALVTSISVIFHQAWQLSAIRQYIAGDYERFYTSAIRIYGTMFFFGSSILIAFVRPVMNILDDSYQDAWKYAPLLLIASVFFAMSGFVCANYSVCEKTGGVIWTSLAGAVCSVALGALMTPSLGMNGTAAAAVISYYLMWLIMTIHTGKLLNIRHEYIAIHLDLLILLAETLFVIKQYSPILIALCPLLLLLVNRTAVIDILHAAKEITEKKGN